MGRSKLIMIAALSLLVLGIGCQPADDSDLISPENDIIVTSPSP